MGAGTCESIKALNTDNTIIIINKIDLCDVCAPSEADGFSVVNCCLTTGKGLNTIVLEIEKVLNRVSHGHHSVTISERHRDLLQSASTDIDEAIHIVETRPDDIALHASRIRSALESVGRVTGVQYEDALLNSIFSRFCIGK